MAPELILHHYEASPYAEKIRLLLAYKQLHWRSVIMPPMLPKPELMALTHGYRRAPVLQIGADLYCDSALIASELERRFPAPGTKNRAAGARAGLISHWVDVELFWLAVRYVMGMRAWQLPQALLDDRAAMHLQFDFSRATLVADLPHIESQLQCLLALLDTVLTQDDFLGGTQPALGDFGLYHPLWFLHGAGLLDTLLAKHHALPDWFVRMRAFGQAPHHSMEASEAIAIALASQPLALAGISHEAAWPVGSWCSVMPEGYPQEAVCGQLLHLDDHQITLQLLAAAHGPLQLHFPRLGYIIAHPADHAATPLQRAH
ncbi:glutathione S-transferase family protein [Craterilacuibacter sp.]|uniref:glutathione S-transferase family protein n=1 Tax=Craterilacuibacter sp. TaxID=2870909 RepID=UPI003F3F255F